MQMGFWKRISDAAKSKGEPLLVMAPLANVTDAAFRQMFANYSRHLRSDGTMGGADAMWTEFVSADGLMLANEKGKEALMRDLQFTDAERPIVVQFFTSNPDMMRKAAKLARELGFDSIDINMGCPDRAIEKQGAGAAMMKNPKLAREVLRAAKEGAGNLPVSIKTRIGYNRNELETWLPEILAEEPAVVTVHCRTRKEMSDVPARWEHVKRAVEIRDEVQKDLSEKTLIFGNGDILGIEDAKKKAKETGADGVMLGRAIFGNPWLFDPTKDFSKISQKEKLAALLEHTELFMKLLGDIKSFSIMKKHYKAYVNGWDGAKELRARLMETRDEKEVRAIIESELAKQSA